MIHWTPEQDRQIQEMVNAGYSAERASKEFGCSRNAVIGRAFRCGLRFNSQRVMGRAQSISVRFSKEEDDRIRELAAKGLRGRDIAAKLGRGRQSIFTRCRLIGIVLVDSRSQNNEEPKPVERPVLRVVANNIPMMVEDWLRRNGGARKFEARCSTDYGYLKFYLEEHGVVLSLIKGSPVLQTGSGRQRKVEWNEVFRVADRFRVAEGLEPILRGVAA